MSAVTTRQLQPQTNPRVEITSRFPVVLGRRVAAISCSSMSPALGIAAAVPGETAHHLLLLRAPPCTTRASRENPPAAAL